jgi:hypothetical protein
LAAIVFIGRTRTVGSNRRSSRVQGELAHIAEAPGGKAAAGGLVLPPLLNRTFLRKCPVFVSTPSQEPSFEFEIYQEVLYLHE